MRKYRKFFRFFLKIVLTAYKIRKSRGKFRLKALRFFLNYVTILKKYGDFHYGKSR